jgi:hypothetical protein
LCSFPCPYFPRDAPLVIVAVGKVRSTTPNELTDVKIWSGTKTMATNIQSSLVDPDPVDPLSVGLLHSVPDPYCLSKIQSSNFRKNRVLYNI